MIVWVLILWINKVLKMLSSFESSWVLILSGIYLILRALLTACSVSKKRYSWFTALNMSSLYWSKSLDCSISFSTNSWSEKELFAYESTIVSIFSLTKGSWITSESYKGKYKETCFGVTAGVYIFMIQLTWSAGLDFSKIKVSS